MPAAVELEPWLWRRSRHHSLVCCIAFFSIAPFASLAQPKMFRRSVNLVAGNNTTLRLIALDWVDWLAARLHVTMAKFLRKLRDFCFVCL